MVLLSSGNGHFMVTQPYILIEWEDLCWSGGQLHSVRGSCSAGRENASSIYLRRGNKVGTTEQLQDLTMLCAILAAALYLFSFVFIYFCLLFPFSLFLSLSLLFFTSTLIWYEQDPIFYTFKLLLNNWLVKLEKLNYTLYYSYLFFGERTHNHDCDSMQILINDLSTSSRLGTTRYNVYQASNWHSNGRKKYDFLLDNTITRKATIYR